MCSTALRVVLEFGLKVHLFKFKNGPLYKSTVLAKSLEYYSIFNFLNLMQYLIMRVLDIFHFIIPIKLSWMSNSSIFANFKSYVYLKYSRLFSGIVYVRTERSVICVWTFTSEWENNSRCSYAGRRLTTRGALG